MPDREQRTPYYGASRFIYDAEHDEYRCPEGHPLRRHTAKTADEVVVYRVAGACPTTSPWGCLSPLSTMSTGREELSFNRELAAAQTVSYAFPKSRRYLCCR